MKSLDTTSSEVTPRMFFRYDSLARSMAALILLDAGRLLGLEGEIDHRQPSAPVSGGHTGQLALDLRQDQADGLGRPGRRRDDV